MLRSGILSGFASEHGILEPSDARPDTSFAFADILHHAPRGPGGTAANGVFASSDVLHSAVERYCCVEFDFDVVICCSNNESSFTV